MTQIGRIGGPLLEEDLIRNGVDIAFRDTLSTTQLLYVDVNNRRIGVNLNNPSYELEIFGTTRSNNLIVDSLDFPYYLIEDNNISAKIGSVYLDAPEAIVLSNLETSDFKISDNTIETTGTDTDIVLEPNGTGNVSITNNLRVYGDIYTPSNITLGGSLIFGDGNTDSVDFNADVSTDIIPDQSAVYNLGSASKRWQNLYTTLLNGSVITDEASADSIRLDLRQGGIFYVASNGDDSNVGDHPLGPFATIRRALDAADSSDGGPVTIFVFPGTYAEQLPLVVPSNVTVIGEDIRNTIVVPDSLSQSEDVFLLNGESTVQSLTVKDFYYDSVNNTGHAFRFAPNAVITSRSPYIQNVSVITQNFSSIGEITIGPDITLFSQTSNSVNLNKSTWSQELVDSLVGQIAVIDIYPNPPLFYTVVSIETDPGIPTQWRMTVDAPFNSAGQIKNISFYPDVGLTQIVTNDIWDTTGNSIGEKWVAWFKTNLPPFFATTVQPGWTINVAGTIYVVDYIIEDPVNTNMWRIYVTTSLVAGVGIPIFSSPIITGELPAGKGALIDGAELNSSSFDASMLFHSCTFITPDADAITMTNGVRVEWLNSFTYFANRGLYAVDGTTGRVSQDGSTVKYGAEVRSIGSANVYGNYGAVADGPDTLMYLIKHNFAYIGTGLDSSNDSTLVIQENEVVKLNSGKIYYQSHNKGKMRIGDSFFVDLERGTTSVDISTLTTNSLAGLVINSESSTTTISGTKIETGNIRFSGNRLDSLAGDLNINSASGVINLNNNTSISSNLSIRDNFSFDGTLNLSGDQVTDRVTFNVEIEQDFNPNETSQFTLGSNEKPWINVYLSRAEIGNINIYDNVIETDSSNANLELRANGTGVISLTGNNANLKNNLTVSDVTSLSDLAVTGSYTINGDVNQTGTLTISDDAIVNDTLTVGAKATFENVIIDDNVINTATSNSNLEFRAAGTGLILIPSDNARINNNLATNNITSNGNATVTLQTQFDTALVSSLSISENYITSVPSNADLDLRASGTGSVIFAENVDVSNDLDVFGTSTLKRSTFAQGFGPQLVVNGTFNTNLVGWTSSGGGTTTRDPLGYIVVEAITGARIASQTVVVVPGALYQFSATLISATTFAGSPDYSLRVFESGVGDRLAWARVSAQPLGTGLQVLTGSFVAATSVVTIALRSANASVRWDNFSLIRDLGIIETITPIDALITGNLSQTGNRTQTGDIDQTGNMLVDGRVTISEKTDFSNYTIDGNVLRNRRFGLSLNRTDTNNPLGFYNIIIAMGNGATADNYVNQTEKNLINFLANGTSVASDYAFSYADANQNGFTTLGDAVFWLQYVANGTTNDPVIDSFISNVVDELIEIEFNTPGTFNKDVLLFGDYFEPDFVLEANGTGKIIIPSNDVYISNDLSSALLFSTNIDVDQSFEFNKLIVTGDNLIIDDNFITTGISNSDLELRSTRNVVVPANNVIIQEDLTVNGVTNLKNTTVLGTIQQTGNAQQTGDLDITGNLSVRFLDTGSAINFNSITTSGNVIDTINSNENLELRANGSGTIFIPRNNTRIDGSLTLDLLEVKNITVVDQIAFEQFSASSNILIFDNVITTTESNSNLELRTAPSRNKILESLIVNNNTISTTLANINIGVNTNLNITSTGSLILPRGTTAQRSTATGNLRFNTSDNVFEGFNNNRTITFNGVYSDNRRTSVLAHPTNNTLNITVNQLVVGSVTASGLTIHGIQTDDINFNANQIRTSVSNANLDLVTNGTGELVLDNISVVGNTIKNNSTGALVIETTINGRTKFATDKAVAIPYGTNLERPVGAELGTARWNTEVEVLEVWDGSTFVTAAGQSQTISASEFQNLMLEYTLIFG
jgi:hypothetical protein